MPYLLNREIWSSVFAVPSEVVDKHLKLCGETALKVLLLLLRNGGRTDRQELSRLTGKPADQVDEALLFWTERGVLLREELPAQPEPPPAGTASRVEVTPLRPVAPDPLPAPCPVAAPPEAPAAPAAAEAPPPLLSYTVEPDPPARQVKTISQARGRLTTGEIGEMARQDENIAYLLQEAQAVLGQPLTPVATDTVVSLYSYYGMRPDLVLMLLQYCVTMGKSNMRYVEKVAASWLEGGIDSHEKAELEILRATRLGQVEYKIKAAFGIQDRKLVPSEQKYVSGWIFDMGFDLELITMAFERAVEQKGKLSFAYINGILTNWHAKGVRTPAEAMREMQTKPGRGAQPAEGGGAKPAADNSASYDIEEIKRMMHTRSLFD